MQFRKDINGLRAIAVIAVVLFHFNASWVPGGFAGVDVFFVISGFLMTGLIFKGIETNNFSILRFYVARANRIIPALSVLCLVLILFGWFFLISPDYRSLGKHVASSIGFLSNIIYWTESGYFAAASHEKWLLHTWSLSVEWQFYIIYPLLLVTMRSFMSIKAMKVTILIGTVLGFIFCVISTYKWPSSSYYMLPARAWEMMIGGVAYIYPFSIQEKRKKIFERLGLILIVASYFLISKENLWPGYLAVFPVFGSFLIIQAQRNDSFITSNVVFQKIGAWSYSIYLWHWPLVVAIYYYSLNELFIYLGLALSVLLGFLSNKHIEKIRFRSDLDSLWGYLKCKPIYMVLVCGLIGSLTFIKNGFNNDIRLTKEEIIINNATKRNVREQNCGKVVQGVSPSCHYGEGPVKAIIIGDSHAQAQIEGIGLRARMYGGSVLDWGLSDCSTIKGVYKTDSLGNILDDNCGKLVKNSILKAGADYAGIPIVIINRTSQYLHGYNADKKQSPPRVLVDKIFKYRSDDYKQNLVSHMIETICDLSKTNPVYLLRPIPELKLKVPKTMFNSTRFNANAEHVKITLSEYKFRQKLAYKMQDEAVKTCGAKILDPTPYLCKSGYCYGDLDGKPLYFDDNHLNLYGTSIISSIYDEILIK